MSHIGQNRLRIDGRFLARGEERIFLKAVTFGPFPKEEALPPREEFPRIAECGFNAIRLYEEPDRELLDLAGENGLIVLAGIPWEWWRDFLREPRLRTEGELLLLDFARRLGPHPALGALFIANEIPSDLARWMGPVAVRETLEHLINACRSEAEDLLVAYSNYPSTEYLEPRNADFTALNVYLEDREAFRRYLPRLQNIAGDRPVVLTEFGLDTVRHPESEQAETLSWHLDECLAAGVAGTTFFAWSDRWATGGRTVTDWAFGLTTRDRSPKPALTALEKKLPSIRTHRDGLSLADPPRISVIICTFNHADILADCLAACHAIDYPDFEVLVVDDGSSDATTAVATRFLGVKYIYQEHGGLSTARNRGAAEASGTILAYTDDDCEPDRDWLFWLARAFEDPDVGAAGGPNLPPLPDGVQEAVVAAAPGAPSHVLLEDLLAEHLPGCNLAIRRSAFEDVQGFQAHYETAGDDVDICWRLLDTGHRLAFSPSAFVWHRRRPRFFGYLRQQWGYGRAEALLYHDHPERFSRHGIQWEGAVYAGGPVVADPHSVIYFGAMGQAPYQGLQLHGMPRRDIERHFAGFGARFLLQLAELLQPWARSLARWRHGGPFPLFRRRPSEVKTYRDDLRDTVEISFAGDHGQRREELLVALQENNWSPCEDTAPWDLEQDHFQLLTATEQQGPDYCLVRVRLLHPAGTRREALQELDRVALEAGLRRV